MGNRYRSGQGRGIVRAWCEQRLADWPVAHDRTEVGTAAGRTHLLVAGTGPATVLYLPGTNFGAATSLPVVAELARGARVVVADLPGQPGLSEGLLPDDDRLAAYGAWAGEVVAHVRTGLGAAGPLVVVGHSLGAAVALAAPPAGVDALALVDPAGLVPLKVPVAVLRATLPWVLRPTERRSRALLEHLVAPGRRPDPDLVRWMTLVAQHTRPTGAPGPLPVAVTARWSGTPRLVLSGRHDCFLPPNHLAPAVRDRLGTDLVVLPGLGHLSVDDDPVGVARAVLAAVPGS